MSLAATAVRPDSAIERLTLVPRRGIPASGLV
jgi:hypothetical protein